MLAISVVQGGVHLRGVPAKFEQFNLVTGLTRIFGMQALWEGAKALLKTAAIGLALYVVIAGLMPVLTASGSFSVQRLMEVAASGIGALLVTAVAVGVALAAVDVLVVMRRNRKHTRMSKQEVRDENKNSEGDPLVRSHRRSRQLAMSRNRMIAAIGGSDVVLVNPTHIAVAVKYEPGKSAPRVVAKGAGAIALRIREKAEEELASRAQEGHGAHHRKAARRFKNAAYAAPCFGACSWAVSRAAARAAEQQGAAMRALARVKLTKLRSFSSVGGLLGWLRPSLQGAR